MTRSDALIALEFNSSNAENDKIPYEGISIPTSLVPLAQYNLAEDTALMLLPSSAGGVKDDESNSVILEPGTRFSHTETFLTPANSPVPKNVPVKLLRKVNEKSHLLHVDCVVSLNLRQARLVASKDGAASESEMNDAA